MLSLTILESDNRTPSTPHTQRPHVFFQLMYSFRSMGAHTMNQATQWTVDRDQSIGSRNLASIAAPSDRPVQS